MPVVYTNNARSTLLSALTNVATSLSVASGQGALFPAITTDYFYVTLTNAAETAYEIVKVTARTTDTFTITRAQDGTTAQAWSAGDKVELRMTKAMLDDFKTDTKGSLSSANVTTALGLTPVPRITVDATDFNQMYTTGCIGFNIPSANGPGFSYGHLLVMKERVDTEAQLAIDYSTGMMKYRGAYLPNGNSTVGAVWSAWRTAIDSSNYLTYAGNVPANAQSVSYQIALTDVGKSIDTTAGVTVPTNATVAFVVGDVVSVFNNSAANITITQAAGVTLRQAGTANVGNRTLAQYGFASMRKVATDTWVITGTGLT